MAKMSGCYNCWEKGGFGGEVSKIYTFVISGCIDFIKYHFASLDVGSRLYIYRIGQQNCGSRWWHSCV